MALPPKSDDDQPSSTTAESDATDAKKSRRARPRVIKPKTEKVARSKGEKRTKSPPRIDEVPEVPQAPPRQEAPREETSREEPPRAAPREPEPQAPREEPVSPSTRSEPTTERSFSPEQPAAPAESSPTSNQPASETPAPRPQHQGGQQHHQHGGGGGRGDWQGQQGQGGDRGFWKHGKRKRGRHGGPWQPGGGGGGGGNREQHPPQPLPPSNAPVFGDLPNPSRFADLAALDAKATEITSGGGESLWLNQLYAKPIAELTNFARETGVKLEGVPNRRQLLAEIFKLAGEQKRPLRDAGYLDVNDRGSFIVHEHVNYRLYPEDAYVPETLIKRYGLKRGHRIEATVQAPLEGERCPSVVRIDSVMAGAPDEIANVTPFEELVPYYPLQRILLEAPEVNKDVSMRAVDILTPIGFGQRGLIVAPPRTGKTVLLQNIANSISANSPEVKLILLLIDERPEEVTDFRRHTKGEVVSSTFDETPESHIHCAEMVIEIARRRVEKGEHVVILLDSITRLARAYNALSSNSGKIMSGGLESNALQKPKRFFGSARNIEGGGSLTIIASALIDTGSRMDEVIFEEFKGTGNSELHLDRGLVERRIFPAINIDRSGTRKEELIYHPEELQRIYGLRRAMQGLGPIESMEMLITRLRKTKSNAEFLLSLAPK
jgi:transcription termination factor Rho